jgi:O-antigen ligase
VYSFARDEFPLPGLYQNPSFKSFITEDPESYALYVKRPFGMFPEPSAMAASIGPWLVLIVGLLLYPKLRHGMIRGLKVQLLLAAVGGVALILLSSSGFTVWLLISLLLVGLPALKDRVLRLHRLGSLLAMSAFVLVGVALVYFSLAHVGSRLDIQENSSWSARLASLVWGLSYLGTSPSDLLFGVGPGQSYLILQSPEASNLLPESSGELTVTAVWSVVVLYIQEMGLLGAVALALTLALVLRAIMRSSARLLGSSCLLAWLVGLLLTTSYLPMLPIWLLLGVLLNWDRIFEVRVPENGLDPGVPFVHKAMRT